MNASRQSAPFTIYLFEKTADHRTPAWRRYRSVATLEEARREMKALYETGNYQKIEIQKQRFCRRRQRPVNTTLIVLGDQQGRARTMTQSFLKPWRAA